MAYIKATDVLPEELLEIIQKYVDGEYLYIPRKESNRKSWGELTNSKIETYSRNVEIYDKYKKGISVMKLSEMFYLSPKSISRIISDISKEEIT